MVPNSLGPAELLLHYGTEVQKDHWLPRLARGLEMPCFALTGPEAGSDAGSIPDTGVVCRGLHEGHDAPVHRGLAAREHQRARAATHLRQPLQQLLEGNRPAHPAPLPLGAEHAAETGRAHV